LCISVDLCVDLPVDLRVNGGANGGANGDGNGDGNGNNCNSRCGVRPLEFEKTGLIARFTGGVLGISKYINLSDKFLIIPEINIQLSKESESNKTISLRYSYSPSRSIDFYYSNAIGIQDLGQNLKGEDKLGIKLNFNY